MDPTQDTPAAAEAQPPTVLQDDEAADAPAKPLSAAQAGEPAQADDEADADAIVAEAEDGEMLAAEHDADAGQDDAEDDVEIEERESVYSIYADDDAAEDAAAAAAASGAAGSSGGTSGGSAIGIDELAIEKWSEEQKNVYQSVKQKAQELGVAKDDVERIAAYSVLQFMNEKDRKPDTRVDRVQAVNANGDVLVRMEHMKYGDREPIFNNDVRLKDAPAFEQTAAQIQQANERVHGKTKAEQEIAQHHQNQDTNKEERPNTLQLVDDQITARMQSSMPAMSRGGR
jgi:hypothetical protein